MIVNLFITVALLSESCLFVFSLTSNDNRKVYDFVIVGGGTAGCILATRLSENNKFSVLLLEAGGNPHVYSKIPMLTPLMWNTEVDWNYTTVPQNDSYFWSPNNQANWPRGKMLGGSSSMNLMNFFRGNKRDFDLWEKSGAKGWKWENVFPFFLKIENSHLENSDENLHGKEGYIPITNPGKNSTFIGTFFKAMGEMGYKRRDPNHEDQFGYDFSSLNIYNEERRTPFTNYLKPVMKCRKNIKVKTSAFVEKIIFNKHNDAIGVIYSHNGAKQKVFAKKEIILSAGAINSPQLLMLSGVGPKEHLQSSNITVISDLPVGNNLQDHLLIPFTFSGKHDLIFTESTINQVLKNKTGPLSKYGFAGGFINTKYSEDKNFPDIQLITPAFAFNTHLNAVAKYSLILVIQRPKSRGLMRLQSPNPYTHPILDPKYLCDKSDVEVLIEGCKIVYNITKIMENNEFGYKREELNFPDCDLYSKSDDKFWSCFVKHSISTVFHACGTCKMGEKSDPTTVVDSELKVKGVQKLRVVDASIMPTIVSANIQATVMMIAEKASQLIKSDHTNFCKRKNIFNELISSNICNHCG